MVKVKKEDRKLVETLKRFRNIKETASTLRVSRKTVYNRMASLRRRWREARNFTNWCEAQVRHDEWLNNRLRPRVKMDEEEEEV